MGRYALLIGASDYNDSRLPPLASPVRDTDAFAEVLRDPARGGFADVSTLLNQGEKEIRMAVAGFVAQRSPDDVLMLYFSCHGILDEDGRLYFAASDTSLEYLSATAVSDAFIRERLDHTCARAVLILDCCHSGAFASGTKSVLGATVATSNRFRAAGNRRIVLTASDATQYAWEGDRSIGTPEPSVFTKYLVEGLRSGDADAAGKGYVTVDDAYDYVVRQAPTSRQRPLRFGEPDAGAMVLVQNPSPKPASLPDDLAAAIGERQAWIRKAAVAQLGMLAQGGNAGQALGAIQALTKLANGDDSNEVRQAAAMAIADAASANGAVAPTRGLAGAIASPAVAPPPAGAVLERVVETRAVRPGASPRPTSNVSLKMRATLILVTIFAINWLETALDPHLHGILDGVVWGTPSPGDTMGRTMTSLELILGKWALFDQAHWTFSSGVASSIVVYGCSAAYFLAFPALTLGLAAAFALRRHPRPYRVLAYAVAIDYVISLIFFMFLPVPERWAYPESGAILFSDLLPYDLGIAAVRSIRNFSALDNCFPSFHVSMTVIAVRMAHLYDARLRNVITALGLLVILSTYVLGIHWLPDMIAGSALALVSVSGGEFLTRRFAEPRAAGFGFVGGFLNPHSTTAK